jgi:hypothetical protein
MQFWERKKNQGHQPEQGNVRKKSLPAKGTNTVVNKRINLEKKVIEKECQREIQQLKILRRMRKDPSWDLAVETLLLCEKNPSDAELIAAAINSKRVNIFSRFQSERLLRNQKPAMEGGNNGPSEGSADEDREPL